MELELQNANNQKFCKVCKFLVFSKDLKNISKLKELAFPNIAIEMGHFYKLKKYPNDLKSSLANYIINNTSSIEKNYILSILSGNSNQEYFSEEVEKVINTFFEGAVENVSRLEPGRIASECSNENGNYVLFTAASATAAGAKRYNLASMRIRHGGRFKSYLPVYKTLRYDPNTSERDVSGVAFQSGQTAYTIGKVKRGFHFRISKLDFAVRNIAKKDRTDLYGLRLSQSDLYGAPYAYRIFAYQIVRGNRFEKAIKLMKEGGEFGDEIFEILEISIGKTIEEKLFGNNPLPPGLTVFKDPRSRE